MRALRLAFAPLIALGLAGPALAQDTTLDGLWFKVKFKASGYTIQPGGAKPEKGKGTQVAYLHLTVVAPPVEGEGEPYPALPETIYAYELYTEVAPDTWAPTFASTNAVESTDGATFFVPDVFFTIVWDESGAFDVRLTCVVTVKNDGEGNLKSATFTSLGGELVDGILDTDTVRGGISMKGKTVEVDQLPFVPKG